MSQEQDKSHDWHVQGNRVLTVRETMSTLPTNPPISLRHYLLVSIVFLLAAIVSGHVLMGIGNALARGFSLDMKSDSLESLLELSLEELTQVTVSKTPERIEDAPASTLIITQRQIQQRGYFTLKQLLNDLPGLDVGVQGLVFGTSTYSVRGISGISGINFIKILQDGIPIDPPGNLIAPVEEQYPLYHVKQVEIVYGPGSALYGADALSLVVNLISDNAQDLDGIETLAAVGEYDDRRVYIKGGKVFGENFSMVAGGHYQEAGNVDAPSRHPGLLPFGDLRQSDGTLFQQQADRAPYFGDTQSYSTFAKITLFEDLQVGLTHSRYESPSHLGSLPSVTNYAPSNQTITDQTSVYGRYRGELTENLTAQLQVDYQQYQMDEDSSLADTVTALEEQFAFEESKKWGVELQGEYTLSSTHRLLGGMLVQVFDVIPRSEILPEPYDPDKDPDNQVQFFPNTNNMVSIPVFPQEWTNIGVFGQWRSYWTDDLSSIIGLRYDVASTYGDVVSPRVGLVYQATPQTTIKSFYGRAFAQPTPSVAFTLAGRFDGTTDGQGRYVGEGFVLPNPGLDPQTLDNVEVSLLQRFPPDVRLTLTGFFNRVQDVTGVVFRPGPNTTVLPGAVVSNNVQLDNVGTLVSYGGELLMEYAHAFDDVGIRVWGSYSFVDGSVERDDSSVKTDLPHTAMHKIKGGLTIAYQDLVSVTPRVRYIGKTHTIAPSQTDPNELVEIPEYVVVDFLAEVNLLSLLPQTWSNELGVKTLSTFVRITNVLNSHYFGPSGVLPTNPDQWPYDPRRTWLGLRVGF